MTFFFFYISLTRVLQDYFTHFEQSNPLDGKARVPSVDHSTIQKQKDKISHMKITTESKSHTHRNEKAVAILVLA